MREILPIGILKLQLCLFVVCCSYLLPSHTNIFTIDLQRSPGHKYAHAAAGQDELPSPSVLTATEHPDRQTLHFLFYF